MVTISGFQNMTKILTVHTQLQKVGLQWFYLRVHVGIAMSCVAFPSSVLCGWLHWDLPFHRLWTAHLTWLTLGTLQK